MSKKYFIPLTPNDPNLDWYPKSEKEEEIKSLIISIFGIQITFVVLDNPEIELYLESKGWKEK